MKKQYYANTINCFSEEVAFNKGSGFKRRNKTHVTTFNKKT